MQPMLRVLLHQGVLQPMLLHHGRVLLQQGLLVPALMMQLVLLQQWRMLLHQGMLPLPAVLQNMDLRPLGVQTPRASTDHYMPPVCRKYYGSH